MRCSFFWGVTQQIQVVSYLLVVFTGQGVQELLDPNMGPIGCPKHWYLNTNLHCVKSQNSKDFTYAVEEA
jgi:hypothetical protein